MTLQGQRLYAESTVRSKLSLFPESEERFFLRAADADVSFTRNEAGEVTALVIRQRGTERSARRVR